MRQAGLFWLLGHNGADIAEVGSTPLRYALRVTGLVRP